MELTQAEVEAFIGKQALEIFYLKKKLAELAAKVGEMEKRLPDEKA